VKAPPLDFDADLIERVLDRHWGIRSAEVRYLPVGFGDHHWHVNAAWDNYFVTVRDLRLDGRAQDADGVIAAGLVARLHVASRERPAAAVVEDFRIPHRSALEAALTDLERPWHTGPFGEQARAEVVAHLTAIQSALEQYDTLVATAGTSSRRLGLGPLPAVGREPASARGSAAPVSLVVRAGRDLGLPAAVPR